MPTDPPEPAHPLDAGLRAQAARRRAELGLDDPKMPGPMRTQLQSEVARQFQGDPRSDEARPGFLNWLFQWQRALATMAAALLMVGVFAWNGRWFSPASNQLALNETTPAPLARQPAIMSAPASDAIAKRLDALADERDFKEQPKPPAVAAAAPPADALAAGKIAAAPKPAEVAPTGATSPLAASAVGQPRSEALASKMETKSRLTQNFVQTPGQVLDRTRQVPSGGARTAQLLNQFEFRLSGNRVEIVEADGSVYAGEIEITKKDGFVASSRATSAVRPPAAVLKDQAAAPAEARDAGPAAQFNFRASGVSNTLRQKVTIEGMYQANPPPPQSAPGATATAAQNAAESGSAQSQQAPPLSRARVVGRALVNGQNVDVEAEATK